MFVIGLTGGIGSGKSAVTALLGELGATVIDADKVGHQAYQPHTETWQAVVDAFGTDILQPNEEVDRRKLGAVVFSDPKELARLNSIMHPRMYTMLEVELNEMRESGVEVAVVEAAILIEAKWTPLVDEVWVTVADPEKVVERVKQRSNIPEEQILSRIKAQMPQEERIRHATVVVENNAGLDELRTKLQTLWDTRVKGKG